MLCKSVDEAVVNSWATVGLPSASYPTPFSPPLLGSCWRAADLPRALENLMFNQFGMYILSELPKMQNMKSFAVLEHNDIDEFVHEFKTLPDGSKLYRFFKELLAYAETHVAFSPYYRVNDQLMVGQLNQYYVDALQLMVKSITRSFTTKWPAR
jgi:hypothetical protein